MLQFFVSLMCICCSLEGGNGLLLGLLFIGPISTDDTGNEEGICIPCSVLCQACRAILYQILPSAFIKATKAFRQGPVSAGLSVPVGHGELLVSLGKRITEEKCLS